MLYLPRILPTLVFYLLLSSWPTAPATLTYQPFWELSMHVTVSGPLHGYSLCLQRSSFWNLHDSVPWTLQLFTQISLTLWGLNWLPTLKMPPHLQHLLCSFCFFSIDFITFWCSTCYLCNYICFSWSPQNIAIKAGSFVWFIQCWRRVNITDLHLMLLVQISNLLLKKGRFLNK